MKKTLLALATLGAMAGSAFAADVTVYGLVDYGFNYQHVDGDTADVDARDSFEMRSGMNSGSRFGIKGSEDLGNGLTVGFVLENGFDADTGDLGYDGRIFGRESQVYLKGNFGTLSFGRVGQLASANGSYGLLGQTSPFSSGWGDSVGQKFVTANGWSRFDNTVTYVSPNWAGFKVHAQYSFKTDTNNDSPEGKSDTDRYYGVAATYNNDSLYLVGIVDFIDYSCTNWDATQPNPKDDQYTVTLGGNYDFGVTKVFALAQYYQGVRNAAGWDMSGDFLDSENDLDLAVGTDGFKGYGLHIGSITPIGGGDLTLAAYFQDGKLENIIDDAATPSYDLDAQYVGVSARYAYHLSKRTDAYLGAGYAKATLDTGSIDAAYHDMEKELIQAYVGLTHRF